MLKTTVILGCLLTAALFAADPTTASSKLVALPGKSPLVTFRIVFRTGAASDPAGKEGLAALTASMLSEGGSKSRSYKQIVDAMYPMATNVQSRVDKEMTTFTGETHVDNLDAFYALFREMLLEPGWRADDFERIKDNTINYLRVSLRGNNDEELGKEVLYNTIYQGRPYGHHNLGTVSAIEKITLEDMQNFYKANYTQANLIVGLAGGYPADFAQKVQKDFAKLEKGTFEPVKLAPPATHADNRMTMVEKNTRSVAYSIGFPLDVKRGDPDYPALLVAQSYFGQHRNSGGVLFTTMRQERGLNYGDYAYIEYFPGGMYLFEPPPNIARRQQIFQVWIRPVEPPMAAFALRLGMYELDKFVREGMSQEAFDRSRSFLSKYVNILTKTKSAELGYAIDSAVYGIPDYNSYVKSALAKLTRDDVNRAVKKHLRAKGVDIVVVAQNCSELSKKLMSNDATPMTYNSPKPEAIQQEDKVVEKFPLGLKAENVTIVPVDKIFE